MQENQPGLSKYLQSLGDKSASGVMYKGNIQMFQIQGII